MNQFREWAFYVEKQYQGNTFWRVHSSKSTILIWWLQVVQHTQNNIAQLYIINPLVWRAFVGLEVKEWRERDGD